GPEELGELARPHRLELGVGAGGRGAVRAPAEEVRGVPEAVALEVVVAHLHHPLDAERLPGEVLLVVPPARRPGHALAGLSGLGGPGLPGVIGEGPGPQRLRLPFHLPAPAGAEAGRDAPHPEASLL